MRGDQTSACPVHPSGSGLDLRKEMFHSWEEIGSWDLDRSVFTHL